MKGTLRANSGDMSRMATVDGLGITTLPDFLVCDELRAGVLTPLLHDYDLSPIDVYAVYLPGARRAARIKAMVAYLWEGLGQGNPAWKD